MKLPITGRCLCGAVCYRISAAPLASRSCWCRLCQYIGAGSATVNVCFPSEAVTIEGELRGFCSVAESGNIMNRPFLSELRYVHVQRSREPPAFAIREGRYARGPGGGQAGQHYLDLRGAHVGLHRSRPAAA